MAMPLALVWDLIARDGASPVFNRVAASANRAAASTGRADSAVAGFGKKALGLLGGIAAIDLGVHIGKDAADFQKAMRLVQTQAGASAAEVKSFSSALLTMSGDVAKSPEELATSMYHVYSALKKVGADGPQMLNTVRIAAEGAQVGNADLEETTNSLTAALASGIVRFDQAATAMGYLNAIVGVGDMKFEDLNQALSTGLLVTMQTFGVSLRDTGAALAVFGDNNIRGAEAATKLRMAVQDISKPAANSEEVLSKVGLSADKLRTALEDRGLNGALKLLRERMIAAGVTGDKMGGFLEDAFTKKAGVGLAILIKRFDQFTEAREMETAAAKSFGDSWEATTHNASFQFQRMGRILEAMGIRAATVALPPITQIAGAIGDGLPEAIHIATSALSPFRAAWHVLGAVLTPVAGALSAVMSAAAPLAPVLKGVGGAALAMWIGFKAFRVAQEALYAVQGAAATMAANARNSFATMRAEYGATSAQLAMQSAAMEAEFAAIGAAALEAAAVEARAAAVVASVNAEKVASSSASTDAMVANADAQAAAAMVAARAAQEAALAQAAAAEQAALAINTAGAEARVGWASLAGPLGLAAIGVFTLVNMFHKSETASTAAADAARAYTDALKDDGSATIVDTIAQQLIANKVPQLLETLADFSHIAGFNAQQFVDAISQGGKPLEDLRAHLIAVRDENNKLNASLDQVDVYAPAFLRTAAAAGAADKLLHILNTQFDALTGKQREEVQAFKALGQAVVPLQNVSAATGVAAKTAGEYASMLGYAVTKNDDVVGGAHEVTAAVGLIAAAYDRASTSTADMLAAMSDFSKSAGTAADRAALIGATLKSANGDALGYAIQMNTAAVASRAFGKDIRQAAKDGKQSTAEYLSKIIDLKDGTINYRRAAAGPLLGDLQSMQDAAMQAAEATFQHARATKTGAQAANAAYRVYRQQTSGQLIDELTKLTGNAKAAHRLANEYFGMPKDVKTTLRQEGADPIVDILTRIGKLLAKSLGIDWKNHVDVDTGDSLQSVAAVDHAIENLHDKTVHLKVVQAFERVKAAGGIVSPMGMVHGPGSGTSDSISTRLSNGEFVVRASQTKKHRGLLEAINAGARGFAGGGAVGKAAGGSSYIVRVDDRKGAADELAKALRTVGHLLDRLGGKQLKRFGKAISQSGDDVRSAFGDIKDTLRDLNVSREEMRRLSRADRELAHSVDVRNRDLDRLNRLTTARHDLMSGIRSAATGSFDITSAGARTSDDGTALPPTFGSIYAAALQDKNLVRKWAAGIRKLGAVFGKSPVGRSMLRRLASAGPDSYPQVAALIAANPKQLLNLVATERQISETGARVGGYVAGLTYNDRIHDTRGEVRDDRAEVRREWRELRHDLKEIARRPVHVDVKLNDRVIATAVATGTRKNERRR